MTKNWFDLPPHPTDELIHWSDDAKTLAPKLRNAYDLIINLGPEYAEALGILVKHVRETTLQDARDYGNPDF